MVTIQIQVSVFYLTSNVKTTFKAKTALVLSRAGLKHGDERINMQV